MDLDRQNEEKNKFLLERYKYVLMRKNDLNDKTFKIVAFYQALLLSVGAAFYTVNTNIHQLSLSVMYSTSLIGLLTISTVFLLLLLLGGIFSWVNSRNHESEILLSVFGIERERIKKRHVLFWYETYIIIAMFVVTGVINLAYYCYYDALF